MRHALDKALVPFAERVLFENEPDEPVADKPDDAGAQGEVTAAARDMALEALRSAEQFIENGFEFGFIRKPDEGDTALETLPKIKAAIHDLQSNAADARPPALEEGFRKGLEAACEVIDAHSEYDRQMCCDGRECGCYGATVHQSMQHYIRTLSSPDHADAGKVEGDGWLPIESAPKDGTWVMAFYRKECVPAVVFYDEHASKWCGQDIGENSFTHWRRIPTPPSSEVA